MDEEALKDAHKLFTETGYDGNLHDFKNLVSTNPEAMKDAHKLFTDTGYNGSEEDFSTLIGASTKKEQAVSSESPLDSAQKSSTSDTSEEKKETQPTESSSSEEDRAAIPENLVQEPIVRPDREEAIEPDLDLDTASLYDQYKEAGKLTLPQQKKIDQQLTAAEKGERGVWENINAYSTGFLTTGMAVPIYRSYTEEELIKERTEKNKTDFLAELPEDVLAELKDYNIDRTVELTSVDLNLLAQNRIIKEKSKAMAFSLGQMHNNIIKIRESGERVPDEAFQMYEDLYKEVEAQGMLFMENVDLIEAAEDSIGNFEEELDLFKKNYGGLDYYKDITRLATATMIGGLMEVVKTGIEMAPLNPVSAEFKKGALKTGDFTEDFRKEITEQQGELRTPLSVDDIESIEDFFQWLGEQTASQLPVLTVLMASGGSTGLVALSAASGGTKMGEMKDEVAAGDEDYTKEEIFFTGMGFAALEFITEKASLGILSKGSRTLKASLKGGAPTASLGKRFAKGFGQNFKAQFKEGSTEFGNVLGQNVLEIVYLEKEDVHVFDNTADAFASGQAMGSGMHAVPAIMGFGIKTFVNKGQQKKMRRDALKLEELTNELESNENLSEESKAYIQNKINAIAESANADLKQIDINLQEIGEDAVQELINLDKEANGIFQEVKVIEESELSDEMKAELKVENKKKIEAISKKKEVLLNNGETRSSKEVVNRPVRLTKLGGSVLDVPIEGDLYIEGQTLVVKEKNGNITELGNAEALADTNIKELGIDVAQDVIKVNNDGSITVEGNTWNIQRGLPTRGVQTNEDGSVKNVSLKDNNGKTVQYEGAVAEDLAYQIKLDEKSGIEPKTQAKVDTKAKAKAQAKVREANKKRADERSERGNKVQEADGSKSSVDGNDNGVQPNSAEAKGKGGEVKSKNGFDITEFDNAVTSNFEKTGKRESKPFSLKEVFKGVKLTPHQKAIYNILKDAAISVVFDVHDLGDSHWSPHTNQVVIGTTVGTDGVTDFVETILHEAIHSVSSPIINRILEYKDSNPKAVKKNNTKKQIDAVTGLEQLFESYKKNNKDPDRYSLRSVNEFIAHISNPKFAKELKGKDLNFLQNVLKLVFDVMGINNSYDLSAKYLKDIIEKPAPAKKSSKKENELLVIDTSKPGGVQKVIDILDKWDADIKKLGKETLGMNLPLVVAQIAITAMRVAAKTVKTGAEVIEAGLKAVQKSDWYLKQGKSVRKDIDKNLVRRISEAGEGSKSADAVTTPHKVKKKKVKTKSQIRKSTGQTDTSAKVTMSKRNALKEKLRTEARAALKGYRVGRKDLQWAKNSLKQLIATYIKEGSGLYTKGEVKRLLAKINKVTDKNFEVVSKETVAYIENHIENRQAKGRISGLKKKLKSAAKAAAQSTRNVKRLAEQATLIDQRYLNKNDLGRYEVLLGKILAATKGVTVKGYKAVDVDKAYNEALALFSKAEDNKNAQLNEEAGIEVTELTEEEIEALSKEKKVKAREVLLDMAEERTSILRSIDISGFSPKHRRWYNHMITAPFDKLGIPALKEFIRVADNIAMNEDFTSAYSKIVSKIVVAKRSNAFLNGIENSKLGNLAISTVKDNMITSAKDVSLVMKQMFGGTKAANNFNFASGFASLSKAYELSKAKAVELERRYEKVIKGVKKRHPKILKARNVASRSVFANLIQGTTEKDFEINKKRIESTIKNLEASESSKNQADQAQSIYDEVKDLKSQQEVLDYVKSKKDGNYELLNFWMKEFADIKDSLKESTEEVYGESFKEVTGNYLPYGLIRAETTINPEDLSRPSHMGGLTNPKQAPTTMARVASANLPKKYMLNLDFDAVMFRKYEKSSYDVHVSEAMFDVKNFLNSPQIENALGLDNVKLLVETYNRMLRIQRNAMQFDRTAEGRLLAKAASTLKVVAATRALGSVIAYPKQLLGVLANSAIRLGKDAPLIYSASKDLIGNKIEIVEQALARRGQIEGGTRNAYEKPNAAEKREVHNLANQIAKGAGRVINEEVRTKLFWSLRTGDTHAAKVTWLAYYKQYLKNNSGYDVDALDMSKEHLEMDNDIIRQKAASYAQQNVEETQIATDESRESRLYSQESSTIIKVIRDIILPYSRFVIQAKVRMMIDMANFTKAVKSGDPKSRNEALRSLTGTIVEQAVFHGMNYFVLKPAVMMTQNVIRALLTGSDEGDEEIDWDFKLKQFNSKLLTDAIPLLIGQGLENSFIELVNWIDYAVSSETNVFDSQKDYEKFLRGINKNKLLYRYGDEDGFSLSGTMSGLGVYQGVLDGYADLYETRKYAFDNVVTTDGYYGNEKHVVVRDEDKGYMQVMFFIEMLSASGLMEAEVYRAMKREQRKKVKKAVKVKRVN